MVWKQITTPDTPPNTINYTWDDYNIIAEVECRESGVTTTYNLWGLDLSGTIQGAGGIGGLLAVYSPLTVGEGQSEGGTALPCYDANGNITEYLSTNGTIYAHYEYSPFGEIVIQSGALASTFTHRFSTKPWCAITGLSEYLFRKYSPCIGRWLNRDPIEERGGINLYLYLQNFTVNKIDNLGLKPALSCSFDIDPGVCGRFTLDASFSLIGDSSGIKTTGTIIQNMTIELHVFDCTTKTEITSHFSDRSIDYYAETWMIGDKDSWGTTDEAIDTAAYPCGTYGYGKWYGVAQYYENYHASHINDPWNINWEYGNKTKKDPHGLPWRNTLGTWGHQIIPSSLAIPSTHGIKRMLILDWNCCGEKRPNNYSYLSISTTSQE